MTLTYTPFKVFHYPEHLLSLMEKVDCPKAPLHVRLKPINVCNHHCWYCAYKAEGIQLGEEINQHDQIPEAKMLEIVDDLISMGVKAVTFSGGRESFLYKPLP